MNELSTATNEVAHRLHARLDEAQRAALGRELMLRRSKLTQSEVALLRRLYPSIIKPLYPRAARVLERRRLSPSDAEDLLQETFVQLFLHISEDGFPDDLNEHVNKVLKGKWMNYLRKKLRDPEFTALPSSGSEKPKSSNDLGGKLDRRAVADQLYASLSPELRAVVEAVFLHELTHAEAAELLDIPLGSLKSRITPAKKAMLALANALLTPSEQRAL